MDQAEIFDCLARKYESCHTYSDCGAVRKVGEHTQHFTFSTFYTSPNKFRINWSYHKAGRSKTTDNKDPSESYELWTDGDQTFTRYYFNDNRIEETNSLEDQLIQAAGISNGVTMLIPAILLASVNITNKILDLNDVRQVKLVPCDGDLLYHFIGAFESPDDTELWIRSGDCAIKQVREHISCGIEQTEQLRLQFKSLTGVDGTRLIPANRFYDVETVYEQVAFDRHLPEKVFTD